MKLIFIIWFIIITIIAFSFPLQVFMGNPYPSLIPYVFLVFIFTQKLIGFRKKGFPRRFFFSPNYIGLLVKIYVLLVIMQTMFQVLLGFISVYEAISAFTIYLLPVLFYCYFREQASDKEIKTVMISIVVASLVVGFYFAYDSYVKLSLQQVTDYSLKAFEYSTIRAGDLAGGDLNDARVAIGYRSFGLLETHSVSGGWVVLGAIALLALIKRNKKTLRLLVVFIFAILLLLGLNFTAMVTYFCIIFLFEFGGISIFRLRFSISLLVNIAVCSSLLFLLALVPKLIVGDVMAEFITNNLIGQKELALGGASGQDLSMTRIILNNFYGYFAHILTLPHTLLLGDGFSNFGMKKGGDIGFVETMAKLGLPFFIVIVCGWVQLMSRALKKIRTFNMQKEEILSSLDNTGMIQFAVSVTTLLFVSELHYTVWSSKSILPIIFFSLALYDRYLYIPLKQKKVNQQILSAN